MSAQVTYYAGGAGPLLRKVDMAVIHPMRHFEIASVIASLLFVAGCASRPEGYLKYEDVPTVTPYHTNEVANSVYRLGYSFGYEDFMAMHANRRKQLTSDPPEAERDGYLAGVAAAYEVWDRQRQEYWRTNTEPFWKFK